MSRIVSARIVRRIRARANALCEYCKIPDTLSGTSFGVDHVIARVHHGESAESNLAWACFMCNSRKGTNLASVDPLTGRTQLLFHPRQDAWSHHFRMSEGLIIPKAAKARATLSLLGMNFPEAFIFRRTLEETDPDYLKRVLRSCD